MLHRLRRRAEQDGANIVTGLGYTLPAVLAVIAVCVLELRVLRTGLFRRAAYWISMVIVLGFQIPVDGWLTKLSRADRHLRRAPHHRAPLSLRHPRRGFPVRLGDGDRGAAAVGTATHAQGPRGRIVTAAARGELADIPARIRRRRVRIRHARQRQSRLPLPPSDLGAAHAAARLRTRTAAARRGLRHRSIHSRTSCRRATRRNRRRRRVSRHVGASPRPSAGRHL